MYRLNKCSWEWKTHSDKRGGVAHTNLVQATHIYLSLVHCIYENLLLHVVILMAWYFDLNFKYSEPVIRNTWWHMVKDFFNNYIEKYTLMEICNDKSKECLNLLCNSTHRLGWAGWTIFAHGWLIVPYLSWKICAVLGQTIVWNCCRG